MTKKNPFNKNYPKKKDKVKVKNTVNCVPKKELLKTSEK